MHTDTLLNLLYTYRLCSWIFPLAWYTILCLLLSFNSGHWTVNTETSTFPVKSLAACALEPSVWINGMIPQLSPPHRDHSLSHTRTIPQDGSVPLLIKCPNNSINEISVPVFSMRCLFIPEGDACIFILKNLYIEIFRQTAWTYPPGGILQRWPCPIQTSESWCRIH